MLSIKENDLKLPLVIGVTGHRDIPRDSTEQLSLRVKEIFENLIEKYPNTPLILLTPLADGADRIVATVALEEFKNIVTVCVPLPMDEKNYKDTFGKGKVLLNEEESQKEYDEIIKLVKSQKNNYIPKKIPMLFDKEKYVKLSSAQQRLERRKQYSIVGEYIAIHSHILIALYNENSPREPGGTKEILNKKLSGEYEYMSVLDGDVTYPEQGVVYSIATPRINPDIQDPKNLYEIQRHLSTKDLKIGLTTSKKEKTLFEKIKNYSYSIKKYCNIDTNLNIYAQQHKKIDCFNCDVHDNFKSIKKAVEKDFEKLNINDSLINKNIMLRRSAAYLADRYYKPLLEDQEKIILFIITLIVFILAIKSNISNFSFNTDIDILYVLFLIPLYFILQKFYYIKSKQEDYRALAEGLRIQVAWNMAKINESVSMYYLSHQRGELDWIRSAIRCTNIFYIPSLSNKVQNIDDVKNYWIEDQITYFTNKIPYYQKKEKRSSYLLNVYFIIFILASIIAFFLNVYIENLKHYTWNLTLLDMGQILFIIIPITIMTYLKSKQLFDGYNDILREYKQSLYFFSRAKEMLNDQKQNPQNIIRNLGTEALRENSAWIITRRTKKYDTPT